MEAATWFAEHLEEVQDMVNAFNPKDAKCIQAIDADG